MFLYKLALEVPQGKIVLYVGHTGRLRGRIYDHLRDGVFAYIKRHLSFNCRVGLLARFVQTEDAPTLETKTLDRYNFTINKTRNGGLRSFDVKWSRLLDWLGTTGLFVIFLHF